MRTESAYPALNQLLISLASSSLVSAPERTSSRSIGIQSCTEDFLMRNTFILASILLLALAATAQSPKTSKSSTGRSPATKFNLKDASGKDVKLADRKGKVVLVNFWATWCEGCQVEIPWFVEFQKEYADRGLVVVGIAMDDDWKSVKPSIEEKKVNYPIVIGNQELGKQYGLIGMPLTALVDREGRIVDVHNGIVDKTATEQRIKDLLQQRREIGAIR